MPCDLILLDLNLPRMSGFEVLEFIKGCENLKRLPVVMLSGSSAQHEIDRCYALGANSYISKPTGLDGVFDIARKMLDYWFGAVQRPGPIKACF